MCVIVFSYSVLIHVIAGNGLSLTLAASTLSRFFGQKLQLVLQISLKLLIPEL